MLALQNDSGMLQRKAGIYGRHDFAGQICSRVAVPLTSLRRPILSP
jgi:hypothetical protein